MKEFDHNTLLEFLNRASHVDLSKKLSGDDCSYAKSFIKKFQYKGLAVNASVGMSGNPTYIPWVAFLGEGQSNQDGIYPVFLYYKRHNLLFLSYGISAKKNPKLNWDLTNPTSIGDYYKKQEIYQNHTEKKYNSSIIKCVYNVFLDSNGYIDTSKINLTAIMDDLESMIEPYKELLKKELTSDKDNLLANENSPFSIKEIISLIKDTGLLYDDTLIKRFAFSLMSKQFIILSGLAGSGKTQLALAFASALVEDRAKQMCIVPVGADWTNREPLLGFPNALQEDQYVRPESGVLDLLIEANKVENSDKPYFLILDEMNMSYVERYFADFLSAMESHAPIKLWKGRDTAITPQSILLPRNLFIIGTINVDETTYMFSPKVLDRANVIEFKISEKEMADFLVNIKPVDCDKINGKAASMGCDFVNLANTKDLANSDYITNTLNKFFTELKKVNAEFGYRSATEIFRFVRQADKNDDTDEKMAFEQMLDAAIVQKLLPKLHGSRKKLEPVLQSLWKLCFTSIESELGVFCEKIKQAKFPLTADKIQRMYDAAYTNGFTSFTEA